MKFDPDMVMACVQTFILFLIFLAVLTWAVATVVLAVRS